MTNTLTFGKVDHIKRAQGSIMQNEEYNYTIQEYDSDKEVMSNWHKVRQSYQDDFGSETGTGSLAEKDSVQVIDPMKPDMFWDEIEATIHCIMNNKTKDPAYGYKLSNTKWLIGGFCYNRF